MLNCAQGGASTIPGQPQMHKRRVSWSQLASFHASTLTEDFDQIEAAEDELRREIQHGHAFDAHMEVQPLNHKIYSL